jgi:hypothetical protein
LQEWMRKAQLPTWSKLSDIAHKFGLENGTEILGRCFAQIELRRYSETLMVPEVQPVLDYAASIFSRDATPTPQGLKRLNEPLRQELHNRGTIRIGTDSGFFRCRHLES